MSTATIPTTSAEILAAQAQSGMEGVAAYQEAKAQLEAQKKTAVSQALSEATSRGAPAGAMPTGGFESQYDDRIASLTEGQASYEANASARDRRLTDYNASVEAARSLIGDEAARSVAPINAQSDYQIRASETQGLRDVDRMNAQWRLDKLRLEGQIAERDAAEKAAAEAAAAAAARRSGGGRSGGGGGGGSTRARVPAKDELQGLLNQYGAGPGGALDQALAMASGAISSTHDREASSVKRISRNAEKEVDYNPDPVNLLSGGAQRGALNLGNIRKDFSSKSAALPRTGGASSWNETGSYAVNQAMQQAAAPSGTPHRGGTRRSVLGSRQLAPVSPWATSLYAIGAGPGGGNVSIQPPASLPPSPFGATTRRQAPTASPAEQTAAQQAWDRLMSVSGTRNDRLKEAAPHLRDVPNNPTMFGAPELTQMASSPYAGVFEPAFASGQQIRNDTDLSRLMEGYGLAPQDTGIASQSMYEAMLVAAQQLNDSGEYKISEADFLAAMEMDKPYEPGATRATMEGQRSGVDAAMAKADTETRQAIEDEWTSFTRGRQVEDWGRQDAWQPTADALRELSTNQTLDGAVESEAVRVFKAATGIPVPAGAATPEAALEAFRSPRFTELASALQEEGFDPSTSSVSEFVTQIGANALNATDKLILEMLEDLLG